MQLLREPAAGGGELACIKILARSHKDQMHAWIGTGPEGLFEIGGIAVEEITLLLGNTARNSLFHPLGSLPAEPPGLVGIRPEVAGVEGHLRHGSPESGRGVNVFQAKRNLFADRGTGIEPPWHGISLPLDFAFQIKPAFPNRRADGSSIRPGDRPLLPGHQIHRERGGDRRQGPVRGAVFRQSSS
jgi:hypothetical protein